MYNFGDAIAGLFYLVMGTTVVAFFLGMYVLVTTIFMSSDWDICSKMGSDSAIIQCMKVYNE